MQVKKQQLELDMEQWTGSKLGKENIKAICCHPAYLTPMQWNARLDESQAGIKTVGRNSDNLRYTDETILMAERKEELKIKVKRWKRTLLMKVKEDTEEAGLKLNIQKLRPWHLVSSLHGKWCGKKWKEWQTLFSWAPESLWTAASAVRLKDTWSLEGKLLTNRDSRIV